MATPQLWHFQVLALVYHQNLCGGPGPEGLGTAATAPCEPHCTAEAPRPRAGPAAVPAEEQGGAAGKQWTDLKARLGTKHCLSSHVGAPQVDATLSRLLDRYHGPEPSETVEMFEGEKFFAAFERGIDVDAGRSLLSRVPWGMTLWPLLTEFASPPNPP